MTTMTVMTTRKIENSGGVENYFQLQRLTAYYDGPDHTQPERNETENNQFPFLVLVRFRISISQTEHFPITFENAQVCAKSHKGTFDM